MDFIFTRKLVIFFSFCAISFGSIAQQTFDIEDLNEMNLIPMEYMNVLIDSNNQLEIAEVLLPENQSQFIDSLPDDFKIQNPRETYWVRFKLKGDQLANGHWVLEAPDCNLAYLDLFYVLDGVVVEGIKSGSMVNHNSRKFQHKNFILELPIVTDEIQFYAKVRSNAKSQFLFKIIQYKQFVAYAFTEYILLGIFYGIIFIMGLYNFFLFLVNKEKINLWYFIYALSCMFVCTIEDGLGFQYLWPNSPKFNYFILHHAPNILLICFLIYASQFLELRKRQPIFFKVILVVSGLSILFSFSASTFLNYTFSGTYFIPFILIYIANIQGVRKGYLPAKFFICAFTFTILGIMVLCFRRYGGIDWSNMNVLQSILIVYALNFGLLIEVVLLSIAQSLKIKYKYQEQRKSIIDKETRLRNIFNSSFDALLVYDPRKESITDANNRASELFQFNNQELKSIDVSHLVTLPIDFPCTKSSTIKDLILHIPKSNLNNSFEADCFDAKGNVIDCEITLSQLSEVDTDSYVIAIKDISKRKETEKKLKSKMLEISEKKERLEAYINSNSELENFAYVASHDMKQPIRSIKSFAQLLKKHLQKNELLDLRSEEYLDFVIGGATNLDNLVRDLLEHSKVSSMKEVNFNSFNLEDIMLNVKLNLNQQISENSVCINYRKLPMVKLERVRIIQLLQNLFSNAIKFRKKEVDCIIEFWAEEQEDYWLFAVKDNGIGIQQEYQKDIFQIFRKLHNSQNYSGNGIGLATCKKIVEQHGGSIWVESEYGVGTTFFFTLKKNLDTFNLMLVPNKEQVLN